jgi:hypothetical protein
VTTPIDGVEMNWQQAQDVLACVEQLVGRHARLMQQAPALSGAADRCAEDAIEAIEAIADPLARWADALDDWARMAAQRASERDALTDRLIAGLLAAQATSEDELRTVIRAAFGGAPEANEANEDQPSDEPVEPPLIAAPPVLAAPDAAAPDAAPLFDAGRDLLAPPAPAAPPPAAAPADAHIDIMDVVPHRLAKELLGPTDSGELSGAFDFLLHDQDPLADAEPSSFDFDDAAANDDLSALQSKDLKEVIEVIEATPAFEVEDTTMGSLGLMDTSALSTDQVRAQLKKIRAERAAAAVAAPTDPPDAVEPLVVEPLVVEPLAFEPLVVEPLAFEPLFAGQPAAVERTELSPEPKAVVEFEPLEIEGDRDSVGAKPMLIAAPSKRPVPFPRLPRRPTEPLVELAVVEVESGPIDVLDVRQLLGEPPSRPSRVDAAVRAALSSPPDAGPEPETSPGTATVDHTDWLETTPTSYPPASVLSTLSAAESVEIELGSVDLVDAGQPDMDSTIALQSVDLSAAMEGVNAEDWLDASQPAAILTSNQSLKALAGVHEPAADDPWAALDISTHGELKAGYASQARPTRAMIDINIGIEYAGRFFTARSVNISSTGVLVNCDEDVADGERVDLFFEMPQGDSIAVQATVSRSLAGGLGRIGLAFITLRYDDRVVIDRYVTARNS